MTLQPAMAQILEINPGAEITLDSLEVLVVEDDEADAFLIRKALKKNPRISRIAVARDGVEAMEWLEKGLVKPDVAIVDLLMPRKNGYNLLIDLRNFCERPFPAIVLSSSKIREDATRSRLRGAIQFITKPETLDELESRLQYALADI